jgi:uncharacterized sodium:solute symporter family permease YidK
VSNNGDTSTTTSSTSRPSFLMNAISLVIGFQTSISIVGLPLEFYYYGFQSYQFALCMCIAPFLIALVFVPFLYKIKSASIYDYLDDKFGARSKHVKIFTLLLSVLFQFVFASLVLFSTAISCMHIVSFSFKIEIWVIPMCLGLLSALLALLGLKSVVMANFFQYLIMLACNVAIIVLGIRNFGEVGDNNNNGTSSSASSFVHNFYRMLNVTNEAGGGRVFVINENFR